MPKQPRWPKFSASGPDGACGHQHGTPQAAGNCALSVMRV